MRPLLLPLLALLLTTGSLSAADPIKATASFSILADIVERVGGDRVVVSSIVGPDSDAHTYSPTVGDARSVAKADIVFINGLGFEGWIGDLIAASGNDAPVITVTRDIEPLLIDGEADPHAWNDLTNGVAYAAAIKEGLSALDPDNAAVYAANQHAFAKEINELLARVQPRFAALPQNQRSVVTAHDAFGYFSKAYGFQAISPVGWTTGELSGVAIDQKQKIVEQIRELGVKSIFVETTINRELLDDIARETGITVGGELYSDAMGGQGTAGETYIGMMRENVLTIVEHLK